jgi:26S proteasome regulatory subunit T1
VILPWISFTLSDRFGSFQECFRYMSPTEISNFLDGAIRNRISVRLIAEQHIALSQAIKDPPTNDIHVGVVNLTCSPSDMIKICGSFVSDLCNATLGASPSVVIDGHADATFA